MKKLIAILLILGLTVGLAPPVWPAALTLTNEEQHVMGNVRVVTGTAAVTSGDTYVVACCTTVIYVGYAIRTTAGSPSGPDNTGHSISGSTVTFRTATDGLTWEFFIVGY